MILLSAITDSEPGALRKMLLPLVKHYLLRGARRDARVHGGAVMPLALSIRPQANRRAG